MKKILVSILNPILTVIIIIIIMMIILFELVKNPRAFMRSWRQEDKSYSGW